MFLRCCDEKIFFLKWELWNPPAYQYAPNYVGTLSGALADEARAELEAVMVRWPELHAELWRQHRDIEDRKAEAHRAEGERQRLAAPGRKKQRGAGPALKVVTAAEE
jgi:hypothetical protein